MAPDGDPGDAAEAERGAELWDGAAAGGDAVEVPGELGVESWAEGSDEGEGENGGEDEDGDAGAGEDEGEGEDGGAGEDEDGAGRGTEA